MFLFLQWSSAADQIEQTLDLDRAFQPGETLLWSPGFQKCWDEMLAHYKLENPQFTPPNKLANALNTFKWNYKETVPLKSHFVILSGTGEEHRLRSNQLLQQHFGNHVAPFPKYSFGREVNRGLTLLSVINHQLTFNLDLQPSPRSLLFKFEMDGKKVLSPVKSFGAKGAHRVKIEGKIGILAYHEKENRKALLLSGEKPDEHLLLIRDPALTTPRQVINAANTWLKIYEQNKNHPKYANHRTDTIEIPEILFSDYANFVKHFPGKINLGPNKYISVENAGQLTQLKMSHQGTKMVTKSYLVPPTFLIHDEPGGSAQTVHSLKNRNFTFDEPFFLLLRKKDAVYPFLFARIDVGALVGDR